MKNRLPKRLQSVLWSTDISQLNLRKDRAYIVNQVLSFGSLEDLRWLFKVYPSNVIKKTFINSPIKTYRPESFNFAKNILLEIDQKLNSKNYVINTPRNIR